MLKKSQIELIKKLQEKKGRKETGLFFVEGEKLCQELLKSDFQILFAVYTHNFAEKKTKLIQQIKQKNIELHEASEREINKICDTITPQGILLVAKIKNSNKTINSSFILLDGIADPGNLGTIIRSADWFGFKNIVLFNNCADIYSPKVIRSSMGAIFNLNFLINPKLSELQEIKNNSFVFYGANPHSKEDLKNVKPKSKFAIIFGNESKGISKEINKLIDTEFSIKGKGKIESLNVAISSAIAMYHFSNYITK